MPSLGSLSQRSTYHIHISFPSTMRLGESVGFGRRDITKVHRYPTKYRNFRHMQGNSNQCKVRSQGRQG
jgi:hypothetical protein